MSPTTPRWTRDEHEKLLLLADGSLPVSTIAKKMGRSLSSVQSYAERHNISLAGYWSKKKK